MPRAFFIDTDVALGANSGDIDDAFAIAAVLRDPTAHLLGITTVFGNTSSATAAHCARAILMTAQIRSDRAGAAAGTASPLRSVPNGPADSRLRPVPRGGADSPNRSVLVTEGAALAGEVTDAARVIAELPEGTTVLALGPLTNIAAALALDRSLAQRISVHLVGGNLSSWGRWAPWWPYEFNLAKDAEAAREVFASDVPKHVYPLDVCVKFRMGPLGLWRLREYGRLGELLARGSLRWLAYAPLRYRRLSFPLWDLVPAMAALGRLDHTERTHRLRLHGRGLLVRDPAAPPSSVLQDLDCSLTPFFALLAPHRAPGSATPGR